MNKKKLLILQNGISHYRVPFYNGLSEVYDVTIGYTGNSCSTPNKKFKELELKSYTFRNFVVHPNLRRISKSYDFTLIMFDLKWLSFVFLGINSRDSLFWSHCYGKNKLLNKLRVLLLKKSNGVVSYYSSIHRKLLSDGVKQHLLFANENTVDVYNAKNRPVGSRKDFIYVGRNQKRKKIGLFIDSFKSVIDKIADDINIKIVGPDFEDLIIKVQSDPLLINRVFFLGPIYDEIELSEVFLNSIGYVSPGHVGLGVLHAFAYGVPVVTINSSFHAPEFSNCIQNVNSIIVEEETGLGDALIMLSKRDNSSQDLSSSAYDFYHNHRTMQQMVDRTVLAIDSKIRE